MTRAVTLSSVVATGKPLADGTITLNEIPGLATVATTGNYNDLLNKPTSDAIVEGSNRFYKPGLQLAYSLIFRA